MGIYTMPIKLYLTIDIKKKKHLINVFKKAILEFKAFNFSTAVSEKLVILTKSLLLQNYKLA